MYHFDKLQLSQFLLWEEQEFVFEKGVTFIHGENGSGKSLLFSSLLPLFYDENHLPKNARASLSFYNNHHEYDFTVFNYGKKTNRYEISIDNKHQKTERINDAKNLIQKHWSNNIQESLFTTTVSLSGLQRHPLATGKPASRLDWVHETLAYASILDSYIHDVDKQIKDTKENSVKYTLLRSQYETQEAVEKPTENIKDIKLSLEDIVKTIKSLEKEKNELEYALNNQVSTNIKKPKYSYKELEISLQKTEKKLLKLTEQKELYESSKAGRKILSKLEEKLEDSKTGYKNLCNKYKIKTLAPKDNIKLLTSNIRIINNTIEEAHFSNELYEEQESLRKFLKKHKDKTITNKDKLLIQQSKLEKELSLNRLVISAHKSGKDYCSACGSSIKHSQQDLENISKKIKQQENKLKAIEFELKLHKARNTNLASYVETDSLESKLKKYKEIILLSEKYINTKEQLDSYKEDHNIDISIKFDIEEFKETDLKYKKLQKLLVDAKVYRNTQKQLSKIKTNEHFSKSKNQLEKELYNTEQKLAKLYNKQRDLNDLLIQTETNLILHRKYKEERRVLKEKVIELRSYNRDFKILSVLKKALGRDGFRTKRLESTLELFVDNLNDLAPLLWKEPFKFEIETGPRKCDVVIHRNNKTGDAFTLSGSEQRRWQLLAGLAMLRLLPSNRRCNTIILDELEANLNMKTRHLMMQDFMPELQKTVPNVIIVSPLTTKELTFKPDIMYVVEKRNNKSRLLTA